MTVGSVDDSGVQWRAVSVRGSDWRSDHRRLRPVRCPADGPGAGLVATRHRCGGAAGPRRGRVYWVVHRSLRPLVEVEKTAAAIADGQLDRRVPPNVIREPRWVGLSLALNGMLAQIQRAVASSEASAEKARTSEERMRRFITDASHELRTPLTTIRGFAELYRQGAARDMEMVMSRIESESRRMGLLVDDLLLLARLDAQRPLEQPPGGPAGTGQRRRARRAGDRAEAQRSPWRCSTVPAPLRCSATRPGCVRCWATWWPTPCSTPRKPLTSPCGSAPTADDAILEVVDDRARHESGRTRSASSSGSIAPTRRARGSAAVADWGCRSSTRWSARTAALSP